MTSVESPKSPDVAKSHKSRFAAAIERQRTILRVELDLPGGARPSKIEPVTAEDFHTERHPDGTHAADDMFEPF